MAFNLDPLRARGQAESTPGRSWLGVKIALDVLLAVALTFTITEVQQVLAFHIAFQALVLMAFFHRWTAILPRAVIAITLIVIGVGRAVADGTTGADELYELPILTLTFLLVVGAVKVLRDTLRQLHLEQERINSLNHATQVELKDQLLLAQRLETLGLVAGGTVHNVRNGMTAIISLAERVRDTTDDTHLQDLADRISSQARQGGASLEALLRYARPELDVDGVDICGAIQEERSTIGMIAGAGVAVEFDLPRDDLVVNVTRSRITQSIVNLVLNASDALPDGGTVQVGVHRDGQDAVITVADHGVGMDEHTRARALDPFFTTKTEGSGSGLGLYTVTLIAEDAGGTIAIDSRRGSGATVTMRLPLRVPGVDPVLAPDTNREKYSGSEKILLAEDDQEVRDQLRASIERHGYTVVASVDGADALDVLIDAPATIDLIVTDVMMPRLSGIDLWHRAREGGHSVPILFMSAFDEAAMPDLPSGADLIRKPFGPTELMARIRGALDRR